MSSLLGKIQMSSLLEIFTGGPRIFFYREVSIFFSDRGFFFTGRGEEREDPEKRQDAKGAFFSLPAGFTVPTATSRLGQPTNGGNTGRVGRKKKPLWRLVFFLGEGWGQSEKRHAYYLDSSWRASTLLSQAQIYFLGQQAARGVGGEGVDRLSANPHNK
jgi:hypothetical protein